MNTMSPPTPNCTQIAAANSTDRTFCKEVYCEGGIGINSYKECKITEAESLRCYEMKRNLNDETKCSFYKLFNYGNYGQYNTTVWVNLGCGAVFDVCYEKDPVYITTTDSTRVNNLAYITRIGLITGMAFLGLMAILTIVFILCLIRRRCSRKRRKKKQKHTREVDENETEIHNFNTDFENHNQSSNPSYLYIDNCPIQETITTSSPVLEGGDYVYEDVDIRRSETRNNEDNSSVTEEKNEYSLLHESEVSKTNNYDLVSDVFNTLSRNSTGDHNLYNSLHREKQKPSSIRAVPYDDVPGPIYAEVNKDHKQNGVRQQDNSADVT